MSGQLLPLYNSILTYKQQSKDDRDIDEIVNELQYSYGQHKHKYLKFVMFPDVFEPCRPPSIFPYPTHMFRDLGSTNLTAASGSLYYVWHPFYRSGAVPGSGLVYWDGGDTVTGFGTVGTVVTGETKLTHSIPTVTGIDNDHVRPLAAYLTLTYVGRLEDISGTIEVGVQIEDAQSDVDSSKYLATSSLKNLYQYKRMDISQGVRCVWLPLSYSDLEIKGQETSPNINTVYVVHITGAPTGAGYFRLDWGYYYDAPVDDTGFNTLLPKRPDRGLLDNKSTVEVIRNNLDHLSVTPVSNSDRGFASKIYNTLRDSLETNVSKFGSYLVGKGFDTFMEQGMSFIK